MGIETAERFADTIIERQELLTAHAAAATAWEESIRAERGGVGRWRALAPGAASFVASPSDFTADAVAPKVAKAIAEAALYADYSVRGVMTFASQEREEAQQAHLLRDIFGNPFRTVTVNPAWQTPTALALAQAAYDHRTLPVGTLHPDRLAILADALEEAGCDHHDILSHLRQAVDHVRGCWVLDLLLGKE